MRNNINRILVMLTFMFVGMGLAFLIAGKRFEIYFLASIGAELICVFLRNYVTKGKTKMYTSDEYFARDKERFFEFEDKQ